MAPTPGRSATALTAAEEVWGAIVFTDIVGFTEFTALEGDEQALALLHTQEDLVNDALPVSARVVKEIGDGLLLWFPDGATAVVTMLELQSRFEDESSTGLPLWVRMGVHCGKALAKGTDLVGHDVNVATRASSMSRAPARCSRRIKPGSKSRAARPTWPSTRSGRSS